MKRFGWSLNPLGLLLGAALLALSLTPSLLPRPAILQGFGAGVVFGLGYAVGLGVATAISSLTGWTPSAIFRRRMHRYGWPIFGVILIIAAIGGVGAQNEVRRMVELPPLDGVNLVGFVIALGLTSMICLAIGRLVWLWWQWMVRRLTKPGRSEAVARHRATVRTILASGVAVALIGGVALWALDRVYYGLNGHPEAGLAAPASGYRSAGAGSAVAFDQLGRTGADFITGGPRADEIRMLTGKPAITPVRVYVGIAAGGTLADRAATAVRELERTGGFEREVLVVAATTGSGWVEPQAVDAVEYLHSGNTATVALQFAYTPSFVTALTAPELPAETFSMLFTAVRAKWLTLPEANRPQLLVYGLSLGAQAVMNSFASLDSIRERTDGALLVGPTNATPLWRDLQASRDPGSPPWQPVHDAGVELRWASGGADFARLTGPWSPPRVAILQHATDPITWLGPELIWQRPEWLTDTYRAPDVSPHMHWIPLVTAVQVTLDMFVSVEVPARHGHAFGDVMLDGWLAVSGDGGLDRSALDKIQAELETYWQIRPVGV